MTAIVDTTVVCGYCAADWGVQEHNVNKQLTMKVMQTLVVNRSEMCSMYLCFFVFFFFVYCSCKQNEFS